MSKHCVIFRIAIYVGLLMSSAASMAQDFSVDADHSFLGRVHKIINRSPARHIDTNYIEVPRLPWRISLRSRVAQTDLRMHSSIDGATVYNQILAATHEGIELDGPLEISPIMMTPVSTSVGISVGYKGISASYSLPLNKSNGQSLSVRSIGRFHSAHLRWHKFEDKSPAVPAHFTMMVPDPDGTGAKHPLPFDMNDDWNLDSPIKIQTLVFDAFYIFNNKRFSYGAAFNQKTIQKRSAGSPIAGIMAYYADLRMDDDSNGELITYMGNIGRIRQWQGSIGAGYAYNYVPAKGWLIGATVMPMVTFVNRMKLTTYGSDFIPLAIDEIKRIGLDDYIKGDNLPTTIWKVGSVTRNNNVSVNFTARLSVTYNWDRYFANINGQFNNFQYKHKSSKASMHGHLNDWYINASVGVRL